MQARNDDSSEQSLDECLTIQSLQCNTTTNTISSLKPQKPRNRPVKSEKFSKAAPNVTLPHSLYTMQNGNSIRQRLRQPHYNGQIDMAADGYYPPFVSNGPLVPSTTAGGVSSSVVNSRAALCHQDFQKSHKAQQMNPFLPNHSSPSHTNLYIADPASPMQTAYPHTNRFPVCTSQPFPPHPPPNYTEATTMIGGGIYPQMPPNYDSLMIGTEYPTHLIAALPNTNHH